MKYKPLVLIVDDSETCRDMLKEMLSEEYTTALAADGAQALSYLQSSATKPSAVLLDIIMPVMSGFEVMKAMQADAALKDIPIICITIAEEDEYKGLQSGAVDYITKPFNPKAVLLRVSHQVELRAYRLSMESLVDKKVDELNSTKEKLLETLANLAEYRSIETKTHIIRTKKITEMLINQLQTDNNYAPAISTYNLPILIQASALHDIGKIGIPDSILLKPGKLDSEEFKIIETHTTLGSKIFEPLMDDYELDIYFEYCYTLSRYHHERWNGRGYPDELKKDEIPLPARIMAVVDVYDALVSERVYKKAYTHEQAVDIIKSESREFFDPGIVEAFLTIEEKIKNLQPCP